MCSLLFCFAPHVLAADRGFVPPPGTTLIVIGQNNAATDDFAALSSRSPAGFMLYTSVQKMDGLFEPADFGAGQTWGDDLCRRYPGAVAQVGLYMVGALNDTAAGKYDENLALLARWIRACGRPVYLRIGYEFDLPENKYEPAEYIKAYRHIADYLRTAEVSNVSLVWHSCAAHRKHPLEAWYPGDEYVDWVAISCFAFNDWILPVRFAKAHDKPVMIAESSPALPVALRPGKLLSWYRAVFSFIEKHDIRMFCYINYNWDEMEKFQSFGWGDASLHNNPAAWEIWRARTAAPRYMHAFPGMFGLIGYSDSPPQSVTTH